MSNNRNIVFTEQNKTDVTKLADESGLSFNKLINMILNAYFGRENVKITFDKKPSTDFTGVVVLQKSTPTQIVEKFKETYIGASQDDEGVSLFGKKITLENFDDKTEE